MHNFRTDRHKNGSWKRNHRLQPWGCFLRLAPRQIMVEKKRVNFGELFLSWQVASSWYLSNSQHYTFQQMACVRVCLYYFTAAAETKPTGVIHKPRHEFNQLNCFSEWKWPLKSMNGGVYLITFLLHKVRTRWTLPHCKSRRRRRECTNNLKIVLHWKTVRKIAQLREKTAIGLAKIKKLTEKKNVLPSWTDCCTQNSIQFSHKI